MVLTIPSYDPISDISPGGDHQGGSGMIYFDLRLLTRYGEVIIDFGQFGDLISWNDTISTEGASGSFTLRMRATQANEDLLKSIHPGMVVEAYCARNADPLEGVVRNPQNIDRIDTTPDDIPLAESIQASNLSSGGTATGVGASESAYAPSGTSNTGVPSADESVQLILAECQRQGVTDPNQIAYILATAKHESDQFNTLREYHDGSDYEGRSDLGNNQPGDGVRYAGRGYVQLTGRTNYERYAQITGIDLVNNPEVLERDANLSAFVLVHGMMNGAYTGVPLGDYIPAGGSPDFWNARRVVNGTDRADLIAGYAEQYRNSLPQATGSPSNAPTWGSASAGSGNAPDAPAFGLGGVAGDVNPLASNAEVVVQVPEGTQIIGPEVEPVEDYYLDKCPHLLMVGVVSDYGRSLESWGLALTISGEGFGKIYKDSFVLTDLQAPELASISLEVRNSTLMPIGVSYIYYRLLKEWVEQFWGHPTGWEARTRPIPFPPNYCTRINSEGSVWSNLQWLAIPGFFHIFVDHTGAIVWEKLPWSSRGQSLISGRNWEDLPKLDLPSWKIMSWGDRLSVDVQNFIRCIPTNQGQSGGQDAIALPAVIYNLGSIRQYGGPTKRELTFPTGTDAEQWYTTDSRREEQATINSFVSLCALECVRWYDRPVQRISITARGESAWRVHMRIGITENWANERIEPGEYYVMSRSHSISIANSQWTTQMDLVRDRRNRYLGIGVGEIPIITQEVVEGLRSLEADKANLSTALGSAFEEGDDGLGADIGLSFDEVEVSSIGGLDLSGALGSGGGDRFTQSASFSTAEDTTLGELLPPNEYDYTTYAETVDINIPLVPDEYWWFDRILGKVIPIGNDPIKWAEEEVIPRLGEENAAIADTPFASAGNAAGAPLGAPLAGDTNSRVLQATLDYQGQSTAAGPGGGNVACVWAVNRILERAGIEPPWGNSDYVPDTLAAMRGGGATAINISEAQPGDIVVWSDEHIGVVTGAGGSSVISNSSSRAAFTWSDSNDNVAAYYGGGTQVFRLNGQ